MAKKATKKKAKSAPKKSSKKGAKKKAAKKAPKKRLTEKEKREKRKREAAKRAEERNSTPRASRRRQFLPKFTPAVCRTVLEQVRQGASLTHATLVAGVSMRSLAYWRQRGRETLQRAEDWLRAREEGEFVEGEEPKLDDYACFELDLCKARGQGATYWLDTLRDSKEPDKYALRMLARLDAGYEDKPTEVNVNIKHDEDAAFAALVEQLDRIEEAVTEAEREDDGDGDGDGDG